MQPDTSFIERDGSKNKIKTPWLAIAVAALIFTTVAGLLALAFYHGPDFRIESVQTGETREVRGVFVAVISNAHKNEIGWTDNDTKNVRVEVRAPPERIEEINNSLNISAQVISAHTENVGPTVLKLEYVANVRTSKEAPEGRVQVYLWFVHPKLNPTLVLNEPMQRLTIAIKSN